MVTNKNGYEEAKFQEIIKRVLDTLNKELKDIMINDERYKTNEREVLTILENLKATILGIERQLKNTNDRHAWDWRVVDKGCSRLGALLKEDIDLQLINKRAAEMIRKLAKEVRNLENK